MNICQWESCVQSGCCVCSQSIKNNNASTIQSVVCNCFNATKRSFCVNMWQWMKHGSTTSLQSQINCHYSVQQQVIAIQSDQRRKHQLAKFWSPYFGMRKVFFSSITLRKKKIIGCECHKALLVHLKEEIAEKMASNEEEKSARSP